MHCCSKAPPIQRICCQQVRNITPLIRLPPHNHQYLQRSVSDLAQVLNVTSSQLCIVSSSTDASMESASFAERLDKSFTSVIRPCRYTSYEISSPLRPTTMLFGCPLPDELDGVSIGQHAVVEAFEMMLGSAAEKHPRSLYDAMCDVHKEPGNDIKLVNYPLLNCIRRECLLMSLFIVSTPTGIVMGPVSG